jgi:hypothetical protein
VTNGQVLSFARPLEGGGAEGFLSFRIQALLPSLQADFSHDGTADVAVPEDLGAVVELDVAGAGIPVSAQRSPAVSESIANPEEHVIPFAHLETIALDAFADCSPGVSPMPALSPVQQTTHIVTIPAEPVRAAAVEASANTYMEEKSVKAHAAVCTEVISIPVSADT